MDILEEIPDVDLPILCEMYKNYEINTSYIGSLLNTCIQWKKKKPESRYFIILGVNNDWLDTGTFVIIIQYHIKFIFFFTKQDDCSGLFKAFSETKRIDWNSEILWFVVKDKYISLLNKILIELELPLNSYTDGNVWILPRENALQYKIKIPPHIYIAKLGATHVKTVNDFWPYKDDDTIEYVTVLIEMNNCYGIFLKSDNSLVSWILKSNFGELANLTTVPEYARKGYASLMTMYMSKEIAEEGYSVMATIVLGNLASENLFGKLGFDCVDRCRYHSSN